MWRPRLEVVAVIVMMGWPVLSPLRAADGGDDRGPLKLNSISAPGPEFSIRRAQLPSSIELANASTPIGAPMVPIRSEPLRSTPRTPRRSPLLIGMYLSLGLLQALDVQSTTRALNSGAAREGNPLVSPIAAHPAALTAFKVGVTAGTIFGLDRLHKSHSKFVMITMAAINGGYAGIVLHNYRSVPTR